MTLYPSGVSWQSILTLDGPSMVTDNVPGPARVVLMKNSDWIPGRKEEGMSYWFGGMGVCGLGSFPKGTEAMVGEHAGSPQRGGLGGRRTHQY